jgi:hypothetical protein
VIAVVLRPLHTVMLTMLTPALALKAAMVAVMLAAPFPTAFMTGSLPTLVACAIEIVMILGESDTGRQRDSSDQNNCSLQPACTHNGPPL